MTVGTDDVTASSRQFVADAFAAWAAGDLSAFRDACHERLQWNIIGTTPLSGRYDGRDSFFGTVGRELTPRLAGPLRPEVRHIIADGERVAVCFEAHAATTDGGSYDQEYCWVLRVREGVVIEGSAYLDTGLLNRVLEAPLPSP